MTTRTRQLLQRSRDLLERSRVAAVQFLDPPRSQPGALPRIIEGSRESMVHQEPEGAVVDICASIALRDLNLVDSLLSQLETMEESEADPDRLTDLYKLDHLAARLRRNAENLRVLAGRDASDAVSESASLVDVIRAAMSSIDGYSRVSIGRVLPLGVVGIAADDLSRLLAELLDNATKQSPPDTSVRVSAHLTDSGSVLMRIEDDGIGLPPERLAELNSRLSDQPTLNDDSVRHMGLAVVRRLAARHQMRARIDRRPPHGTTVTVLLPTGLLCELPESSWSGSQTVVMPAAEPLGAAGVPAARRPSPRPRHAADSGATTAGGLPRRTSGGRVATRPPQPRDLTEPGRTANGLPRRVSRSIKNPDHGEDSTPPPPPPPTPEQEKAGHEQLLADLDAFTSGEEAAKETRWPADEDTDAAPGTEHDGTEYDGGQHTGHGGRNGVAHFAAPETTPEAAPHPDDAAPEADVPAPEDAAPESVAPEVAAPDTAAEPYPGPPQGFPPAPAQPEAAESAPESAPPAGFELAPEPAAEPEPATGWAEEQGAYQPDSMFDAEADATPTPPRGTMLPTPPQPGPHHDHPYDHPSDRDRDRDRDQPAGGTTP
jgi:hypothetical protein